MSQTVINYRQPKWLAEGQIADTSIRRLEGAMQTILVGEDPVLPAGRVIVRNAQGKAVLPSAAASSSAPILGISLLREWDGISIADLQKRTAALVGFPVGSIAEYMQLGDVVMLTEEAITAADVGAPVFYRYASGAGGTEKGRVRKTAVASEAESLPNSKFVTIAPAGGLVVVRIGTFTGAVTAY